MTPDNRDTTTQLRFGKYKDKTLAEVASFDKPYLQWLVRQPWTSLAMVTALEEMGVSSTGSDSDRSEGVLTTMPFGKYKGRELTDIVNFDSDYLEWLSRQTGLRENLRTAVDDLLGK